MFEKDIYTDMYFQTFCCVHQIPCFLFGVLLYYLDLEKKEKYEYLIVIAALAVGLAFGLLNISGTAVSVSWVNGLLFSAVFVLAKKWKVIFRNKAFLPFSYIGKYSLGIYCIHQVVINVFMHFFNGDTITKNWIAYYILVMMFSVA